MDFTPPRGELITTNDFSCQALQIRTLAVHLLSHNSFCISLDIIYDCQDGEFKLPDW